MFSSLFEDIKFTTRLAVVSLGFSGLLLLMGALVWDSSRQMRGVTENSASLRQEDRERDRLLGELRTNTYRASSIVRDYLLEPTPADANPQKELTAIRARSNLILADYGKLVLPGEEESFKNLKQTMDSYLQRLIASLPANVAAGKEKRMEFVQSTLLPLRTELVRLVSDVDALDKRDTDSGEDRIQALQSQFRKRVQMISLIALIAAGVLSIAVLMRQGHLEREAERQYQEVSAAREALRRLSSRLVAAQEEERRKLSRELHDEVGQSMTAMLMDLGRLESRINGLNGCRPILASIRRLAEENVARVRDLSLLLRPAMLDELGLIPALHWQAREVERRSGLRVKVAADENVVEESLPDSLRTGIYRIAQEALHNVVKHAQASEARVHLYREQDSLMLSIQDNGNGFDVNRQKGMGLLGIEERSFGLGGRLSVESQVGGTVLSVRLPLADIPSEPISAGVS